MKVRIAGNRIRFRLKQHEVEQFGKTGTIAAALEFGLHPSDKLAFTLCIHNAEDFQVKYTPGQVTICVPLSIAGDWTSTDRVGFEADVNTVRGKLVAILVEKDFVCMDGREEDNIGSYPNPLATIST